MSYVFKVESANTFICESNGIPLKYSFQWLAMVGVDEYISGIIGGYANGSDDCPEGDPDASFEGLEDLVGGLIKFKANNPDWDASLAE